jgi:hypothetical protein
MGTSDDILRFWFPPGLDVDEETHRHQCEWWFRSAADQAITQCFTHVLEAAAGGELDHRAEDPRSRLALIIILDRFSRSAYRDTIRTGREGSRPGHRRDEQRALRYSVGENVLHSSASAFRTARNARKDGCFVRSDDCRSTGVTAQDLHVFGVGGARASRSDCSFSPVAARIATGRSP